MISRCTLLYAQNITPLNLAVSIRYNICVFVSEPDVNAHTNNGKNMSNVFPVIYCYNAVH